MKTIKSRLYQQQQIFDFSLVGIVAALLVFGLIMVYDASIIQAYKDFGEHYYYIKQQLVWIILGLILLTFFAYFDYHRLKKLAPVAFFFSALLLLAVFVPFWGSSSGGAQRWLNLGFISIQPSELFKLTTVLFLAVMFEKQVKLTVLCSILAFALLVMGILQKDLGSTVVFALMSVLIYLISGGSFLKVTAAVVLAVASFVGLIITSEYRKQRITAFLDPFSDPQGFTYHISQVLIALGSGGLFGLGFGQSRQKFEYIPEVSTDSIFAIIGEELGFIGGVILIFLFGGLFLKGIKIAENAPDRFGKILAGGTVCWLGIQTTVNLSAMVALLPLTGVPLPFISYGGSALLVNLAAVGILLNISKQSQRYLVL